MATSDNTILGLKMPTDPRWVDLAALSIEEILTDHAFCEQKAATQGISIIQRNPDKMDLVAAIAPLVTEEWGHFRMVLAEMQKRGYQLGRQRKDDYVNALISKRPTHLHPDERLMHDLLLCALIEARSCERFRILSEELEDPALRKFYHKFMVSEAGHYRMFLDLAYQYFEQEKVRSWWTFWLQAEVEVLESLAPKPGRIH